MALTEEPLVELEDDEGPGEFQNADGSTPNHTATVHSVQNHIDVQMTQKQTAMLSAEESRRQAQIAEGDKIALRPPADLTSADQLKSLDVRDEQDFGRFVDFYLTCRQHLGFRVNNWNRFLESWVVNQFSGSARSAIETLAHSYPIRSFSKQNEKYLLDGTQFDSIVPMFKGLFRLIWQDRDLPEFAEAYVRKLHCGGPVNKLNDQGKPMPDLFRCTESLGLVHKAQHAFEFCDELDVEVLPEAGFEKTVEKARVIAIKLQLPDVTRDYIRTHEQTLSVVHDKPYVVSTFDELKTVCGRADAQHRKRQMQRNDHRSPTANSFKRTRFTSMNRGSLGRRNLALNQRDVSDLENQPFYLPGEPRHTAALAAARSQNRGRTGRGRGRGRLGGRQQVTSICYSCGKPFHRYQSCFSTSDARKAKITAALQQQRDKNPSGSFNSLFASTQEVDPERQQQLAVAMAAALQAMQTATVVTPTVVQQEKKE